MITLKNIKYNESNPRYISEDKLEKLKTSIQAFEKMLSLRPIVVDENNIVLGGNMRLRALHDLGYKEVPEDWIKKASDLTEAEKREFIIKDNVGFGSWDWDTLANDWEADELESWGLDVPGWEAEEANAEEDYYTEPENIQVDVMEGDLIEIGEHRLLCGDSTDSDQVDKLMNGEKADMVFTDPPYEVDFDYGNTVLFSDNCHVFVFGNDRALIRQLQKSPLEFKKFFVFNHSGTAIPQEGGNEVFLDHVLVSHEVNGKPIVRYNKGGGTRTVIKGEYRRSKLHKHEKPISFLAPIIKGYTNKGFSILDFFAGSGSMFSVAHQLNRKCYGMEIDPKYCQVVIYRMHKLDPSLEIKINGKVYEPKTVEN